MSSIQASLLDVWADLRARRLVPVAALLVAGLVAVPLLLSKKSEEPAAPPAQPAAQDPADQPKGPEALAQVRLDEFAVGSGSSLDAFDVSNPFAPPAKVVAAAQQDADGAPTAGGEAAPGTTGGTDTGATDTGGTGTGGTGTGDTGTGDTGDQGGGETKTTEYTYVIDATFWVNGRKRKIEGMEKLDMLPNEAAPLLILMGATENGGNAVFLVDSTLSTAGEGKCKPSRDDCAFLYLGAGSEQEFTNDEGDSYRLLINQIRRVKLDDEGGSSESAKNDPPATASLGGSQLEKRRFTPPLVADLIVESTTDSTGAQERR
jgi:hypothetical protein